MSKKFLETASAIIIGNEILNASTKDTNSFTFAEYCLKVGLDLMKVEVVPDVESEIEDALRRHTSKYDVVVTSGGIGPTHDDITYAAIARTFNLSQRIHSQATERWKLEKEKENKKLPEAGTNEYNRVMQMMTFPMKDGQKDDDTKELKLGKNKQDSEVEETQVYFSTDKFWTPVVCVNRTVLILPGIPSMLQTMLEGMLPAFQKQCNPDSIKIRKTVDIKERESVIMANIESIWHQAEEEHQLALGSYPKNHGKLNAYTQLSIIGRRNQETIIDDFISQIQDIFKDEIANVAKSELIKE